MRGKDREREGEGEREREREREREIVLLFCFPAFAHPVFRLVLLRSALLMPPIVLCWAS